MIMNCQCIVTDHNHLIVHMYTVIDIWMYAWPDLYTRLAAYARLHIMTSVVCLQLFYLSFICTFIHVIVIQCLFIMLFSVCSYLLLFCAHCLHARAVLFTHTLTRSLSDDPEFARPEIGRLFLLCRCSMRPYILRGADLSPFWVWYPFLSYSCYYSLIPVYHI